MLSRRILSLRFDLGTFAVAVVVVALFFGALTCNNKTNFSGIWHKREAHSIVVRHTKLTKQYHTTVGWLSHQYGTFNCIVASR